MTRWVERVLDRYGQEVTVERDESVPETLAIGHLDGRLWLYLGRAALEAGDAVTWNGRRFRVRSGRPHYVGAALSHWRAVLERARETE